MAPLSYDYIYGLLSIGTKCHAQVFARQCARAESSVQPYLVLEIEFGHVCSVRANGDDSGLQRAHRQNLCWNMGRNIINSFDIWQKEPHAGELSLTAKSKCNVGHQAQR